MSNILEILIKAKDEATEVLGSVGAKIDSMSGSLKTTGLALAGTGAAITGMTALSIKGFADTGEELLNMSTRTGMSVKSLSELKFAAESSGTSLGSVEAAVKKMQLSITDAANGNATAKASFDKLGLSVDALKGMSPEQQFMALSTAIADIQNPADKTSAAVDAFGKTGTDLLPMLADGSTGLETMMQKADDLGLAYDDVSAGSAANFNSSVTDLTGAFKGFQNFLASSVIPVLQPFIEKITGAMNAVKSWTEAHPELSKWLAIIVTGVGALLVPLGTFLTLLPSLTTGVTLFGKAIGTVLNFTKTHPVILALSLLIALGVAIYENWDTIKKKAVEIWSAISDFFKDLWSKIVDTFKNNWDKILLIIFPPAGIVAMFVKNWDVVVDFFKGLWQKIEDVFQAAHDWIMDKVNSIVNWFLDRWNTIVDNINKVKDFLGGLFGGGNNNVTVTANGTDAAEGTHNVPGFATGGTITKTGLAYVHAGETITSNGGSRTIVNQIYLDSKLIAEQVITELGHQLTFQGF